MTKVLSISEAEDLVDELHSYMVEDLGLEIEKPEALSTRQAAFAACLGLQREQTQSTKCSSKVPCPIIASFPQQLCGKWAASPESIGAAAILDDGPDVMRERAMWKLLLYVWLGGAGGANGQPWKMLQQFPDIVDYNEDCVEQAFEALRFAMHCVQSSSCKLMAFFSGDGLDKNHRLGRERFLMLVAWHKATPALTSAFNSGGKEFVQAMKSVDGMGELCRKEILSYLCVSKHDNFRTLGSDVLNFGPGARNGALGFLGVSDGSRKDTVGNAARALRPKLENALVSMFPHVDPDLTIVDVEIFCCYCITYAKLARKLRHQLNGVALRKASYEQAVAASTVAIYEPPGWSLHVRGRLASACAPLPHICYREIAVRGDVPEEKLQQPASLAKHWRLEQLATRFVKLEQRNASKKLNAHASAKNVEEDARQHNAAAAEQGDSLEPQIKRSKTSLADDGAGSSSSHPCANVAVPQEGLQREGAPFGDERRKVASGLSIDAQVDLLIEPSLHKGPEQASVILRTIQALGSGCSVGALVANLNAHGLQTEQTPRRIWQYYRKQLQSSGFIRITDN
eukprot:TRINITY_DN14558_c0_g3_i1.p1 TRINITY_DN14558_c0_g3~~TRINITY_DN14558_c0_g3_i1.p1  ORF type:complete len:569 (-),score=77.56 TRINITY_DN14558_c0_g3_i1:172-1878(-)